MSDTAKVAKDTRESEILNILTSYCGQLLTPDKVEEIANKINKAMDFGPCSWAFKNKEKKESEK